MKKRLQYTFVALLSFLFLLESGNTVFATQYKGFIGKDASDRTFNYYMINDVSEINCGICQFAVSSTGNVAILFAPEAYSDWTQLAVFVDDKFAYGFEFSERGANNLSLLWEDDGETLLCYRVVENEHSGESFRMSLEGVMTEKFFIMDIERNIAYAETISHPTTVTLPDGTVYIEESEGAIPNLRRKLGLPPSFGTKLTKISPDGTQTVLYQVSGLTFPKSDPWIIVLGGLGLFMIYFFLMFILVIHKLIQREKAKKSQMQSQNK